MTIADALESLRGSHDLRLSSWGPYTKRYMGVSHIPDPTAGMRFDLSVFPGLYRRGIHPPNVLWESGYHPWEAAPDLSFYRHRYELLWKDQVYADVDVCRLDEPDDGALVWARCVNATDAPQNLVMHWIASLHFPPQGGRGSAPLQMARVDVPAGGIWIEALDYAVLSLGDQAHRANLTYDGLRRGEVRVDGFVNGLGLGQGFGAAEGDAATYRVELPRALLDPALVVRYRLPEGVTAKLDIPGLLDRSLTVRGTGVPATRRVSLPRMLPSELIFTVVPKEPGAAVELDGFAILPEPALDLISFEPVVWNPVPQRLPGPREDTLLLDFDHVAPVYGLAWGARDAGAEGDQIPFQVRELHCDDLDTTLKLFVHDHAHNTLRGPGAGHFTDVFQRPIFLKPHSERVIAGLVCAGEAAAVRQRLSAFDPTDPAWADLQGEARRRAVGSGFAALERSNPSGEPYRDSQARMAATVLTNVVYPVRTRSTWIRHYTPGRWWDSLYTWDSGFIGLGLAELDLDRALDNLNAYVTEPRTPDAAFIHHGSLVPTQFYVFLALWERTQSEALLSYFYPRLQQYHRFFAGRLGSSTTRNLQSNLLRPWDYFYNSGGWDDYPPQVHVHRHGLQATVTPVITTAQAIRTARIMRMMALALGEPTAEYEGDIELLSRALQTHAWDEDAGYFSYVEHDEEGAPTGMLRHASGVNFNMGMDGAAPLMSGACTPAQEARLVEALMSEDHMWSRYGLSTVDRSAPYYREDGYWNGAVWMPHQWFFWKALLDLGRGDDAHRIARTALEIWQTEVERSHNCFEHFILQTGRGAGWHHFGGLSTPVLMWYGAYHRPGRLTVGFDMWIEALEVGAECDGLTARLRHDGASHHTPTVIATLVPGDYRVTWNDEALAPTVRYPGTLEITLPANTEAGTLQVQPT
ncbi:MAG: MGH1-like glycoside hydrolase domain-containing protein [Anaerolineae bacterium]